MRVSCSIVVHTSPMQTQSTSSGVSALITGSSSAAAFSSGLGRWLRMSSHAQRATSVVTAIQPPQSSSSVTQRAIRNPPSAVMNQPEMTAITPVMRYTALSRPQVRSASDEPMATMNTT